MAESASELEKRFLVLALLYRSKGKSMIAYRAGELDSPRGIFFADSYDSAWLYSISNGKPVIAFEIDVEVSLVIKNQYSWVAEKTGKTIEQVKAAKSKSSNPQWLREIDKKIMEDAQQNGYDSVIYNDPTTPTAEWEIQVFSDKSCKRLGECDENGNIILANKTLHP